MCGRAVEDGADLDRQLGGRQENGDWSVRMQAKSRCHDRTRDDGRQDGGLRLFVVLCGLYGEKDTGMKLTVEYSLDGGMTWLPVANNLAFNKGEWKRYGYKLDVDGLVRLKFSGDGNLFEANNVDDIQMSDYGTGDGVRQIRDGESRPSGWMCIHWVAFGYVRLSVKMR